jgi:peptidoglycan/LPS O-acetylase OafA/YrhL
MFGCVRLLLAAMVALSHVGVTAAGYNPGPVAVISFYLISGYVTAGLLANPRLRAVDYYGERALRLLPSYAGALVIAVAIWQLAKPADVYFLQGVPGWLDWVSNLTIVPLNFYRWSGQDHFTLIPPAWSLAAEMQFYVLAPFIIRARSLPRIAILVASIGVWLIAQAGYLQTDWWGYRLAPGMLFVFILGAGIFRSERLLPGAVWLVATIVLIALGMAWVKIQPFNVESSVGLLLGIPMLAALSRLPRRRWDDVVGRLAYPMFLLHFPIMWLFAGLGYGPAYLLSTPSMMVAWLVGTLIASWLLFLITEAPLMRLRHSLRRNSKADRGGRNIGVLDSQTAIAVEPVGLVAVPQAQRKK